VSTPRHHTEWLGLIDQSGPFLSLPVLLRVFPQGLDMVDGDLRRGLAQAYAEWQASGEGGAPDPVLHQAWIRFVLEEVLDLPEAALLRDQSLPPALRLNRTEEGEVLRPDLALVAPAVGGVVEAPVEANPTPDLFGDAAPQAGAEAAAQATAQMSALPDSSSAAGQAPPGDLGTTADQAPRQSGRTRLLIQTWPVHQRLDRTVPGRFWKASPAARMADLLRAADVPLGLVTNGEDWLLIYAPRDVETASYATWHASLWREEPLTLRALVSLLGARRFFGVPPEDGLAALFAESAEHQQDVTEQLGAQVLAAVEILIQSIDRLDKERGRALLAGYSVTRLYEAGLTVMMRLVFLLFAEERFLLPADNPIYAQHYAVSTLGGQLREVADQQGEELLERRYDAWNRLLALFRLIYAGSEAQDLRLPAYGGHLFDPDAFPFLEGRPAGSRWLETPSVSSSSQPLAIHNRTVLHLLEALQTLELATPGGGPAQARRLSFRALTEENIGSVYEGLLDHTARRTPEPVLGLTAAGNGTVHLALAELETLREQGIDPLAAALKQQTKRSLAALRRAVTLPEEGAQANGQPDTANAADAREHSRLRTACDNDDALQARVLPFAALLRADSLGYPVVISAGSVFVSAGQDRRSSGTHYTPPELTEPMVRHALDPLVYAGLAEGVPPSRETLRPPAEILALKVCDLACGSGAFLVQACRYLADKLVAAWERLEAEHPGEVVIAPDGMLAGERPPSCPIPSDPEERRLVARRLVADRCLYGVDVNPLAVEMAKLSLWLATLQRDRPFTFLDHALVAGDSLLGVAGLDELTAFYIDGSGQQRLQPHADALLDAAAKRAELAAIPDNSLDQVESKALLLADAEEDVRQTRLLADLVTGAKLAAAAQKRTSADDLLQTAALLDLGAMEQQAADWLDGRRPLHWPLAFPEVFLRGQPNPPAPDQAQRHPVGAASSRDQAVTNPPPEPKADANRGRRPLPQPPPAPAKPPGFDAFIGNPPFMGGKKISGSLGKSYREYLSGVIGRGVKGNADLCAYFFLRAARLLRPGGMAGLLATNTIAQGDTREVGLDQLTERGLAIPRAIPSRKWPGGASLEVAHVWLHRSPEGRAWQAGWTLNDQPVSGITAYLAEPGAVIGLPKRIAANAQISFQGSVVLGTGFLLDECQAKRLLLDEERHRDCVFPYLSGEDLNSRPFQDPSRWVINFQDWPLSRSIEGSWASADAVLRKEWLQKGRVPADYPDPVAADYPILLDLVEARVKPQRAKSKRSNYRERWWRFAERCPGLYAAISGKQRTLVIPETTKYCAFSFCSASLVFSHMTKVIALDTAAEFALLNSSVHEIWTRKHSSTLETRLKYVTTDAFETFPFPNNLTDLEAIGERYYSHRQQIMQARQEGLTKTYNRFHDPAETSADIAELRALHVEMDQAVAAAYGWDRSPGALDLGHGFHDTKQGLRYTLSEPARREVLDRLLRLNHERYAEEVIAGLHDKGAGKRARSAAAKSRGRSKRTRDKARAIRDLFSQEPTP
jgi:hypothetical protein